LQPSVLQITISLKTHPLSIHNAHFSLTPLSKDHPSKISIMCV
jgi:hypothetical protein